MIITRTPFRISFFGGGTDYPVWFENNGGAVLSASINKYCYISCRHLPPFFDYKIRITWSKTELVKSINEIQHPAVKAALEFFDIQEGLGIHYDADLPARAGLGTSSSFAVGLLHALHAFKGEITSKRQLALEAIHIEQEILKENVGCQDQAVAAFGGFNKIEFGGPDKITISPIPLTAERLDLFQNHLMLFFTGFSRTASEIAAEQIKNTPNKTVELTALKGMVDEAIGILSGSGPLDDFGKLLDKSWQIKKTLSSQISNSHIDEIYAAAKEAGALGGKLLGAGGGGFILFFVKPESQPKVREKLKNLLYVPFKFENMGSQIIYYGQGNNF
ncbi:MAG: kinase [Candidatus Harrisonbacteria bacterium CG10_big_fil_rev_8_21_14_0_10_45_28]|uniref:Kinase n=1 Tax=Candidatus Harrisonbacteria bacterium CG10_big_fil_rev_8_21_14_0_10_45_28 TaxID=1974586 RepID=A0A2H0UNN2_9BACT|nr:MAG: kinase [Candidatus Harrisonbacteria bacterium CG10_big_fil_rev_8_21_14_0_10_45_28]